MPDLSLDHNFRAGGPHSRDAACPSAAAGSCAAPGRPAWTCRGLFLQIKSLRVGGDGLCHLCCKGGRSRHSCVCITTTQWETPLYPMETAIAIPLQALHGWFTAGQNEPYQNLSYSSLDISDADKNILGFFKERKEAVI